MKRAAAPFLVRRRLAGDGRAMRAVARATWRDTYEAVAPAGFIRAVLRGGYDRARLLRGLVDPRRDAFVVEADGRVVGYADLVEDPPGTAELARIYVHPSVQGTGAGSALLDTVLETCRARAVTTLVVYVDAANPRAQDWYRSHGFHDVGRDFFTMGPWTRPVLGLSRAIEPRTA